jgi:hypothetical protein
MSPATNEQWAILNEVSNRVLAVFADWQRDNTPTTRGKLGAGTRLSERIVEAIAAGRREAGV